MKKRLRLVRRCVRSMIVLALVCVAVVFLFPEWCVRVVVMNLMPGVQCTVDDVQLHSTRVDLHNLRIAAPSFTVDVAAAVVHRRGGQWLVQVASGSLALASTSASSAQRAAGTSTWTVVPTIAPPTPVHAIISNLSVHIAASSSLPQFEVRCHITAVADARLKTQVWAAATAFLAGQSNSEVHVGIWQSGSDTGIELPGTAFDATPLLKTMVPGLSGKSCPLHLDASAVSAPVWGTASLVRAACALRATAPSMSYKPGKLTLKNPRLSVEARLKRAWTLPYVPKDPVGYLLARFDAAVTARVDELRVDILRFSNVVACARVVSNRIELVATQADVCGGTVTGSGVFERRKVKGKDAYRFLYAASVGITNVDAGVVCHLFKLDTNRVEGVYNGAISASGFGHKVTSFSGELQSSGAGVLFFPESQKYVTAMEDGAKKQVTDIMVQQFHHYPFNTSRIAVQFVPDTTTTVFHLEFSGIGKYSFPIDYNLTWLDAVKILMAPQ